MLALLISILISLGIINEPAQYDTLSNEEKTYYETTHIVVEDYSQI